MKGIKKFIPEALIIALLNLALLAITNGHGFYTKQVMKYEVVTNEGYFDNDMLTNYGWYAILLVFSFALSFFFTKFKKISSKKRKWIVAIYTFIPAIIDLSFRRDGAVSSYMLIWIFLLTALAWILIRYEVDDTIQ